ncbi:MAG: hypothetical protein AMJ78_08875 [Omnitrophica WOR_2 bacterium SM23_29]|nr:MAG: hypothetical protein AMJ78_08875 [Omnitrophica WOR_2 bacterium SM23_29]
MADAKNILLIRTDRIGELLLTTPAMRAMRGAFPKAKIAVIVNPFSADVVEGSPYVGSIIKFDVEGIKRNFIKRFIFFKAIKQSGFDLVVIFNPNKFFNILTFLAGIPVRVGYDRKWGFLLSHKMKDRKYLCEKHEVEYDLDLVGLIGVDTDNKLPYFPLSDKAEEVTKGIFEDNSLAADDLLVAVHPAASNPDKMWPLDRFAQVSDKLIDEFGAKIIFIGGREEANITEAVKSKMKNNVLDLTGALSIKELGSILKRCKLLISNDSGPVHIAAAVGTPTIVLFGEDRPGGSSKRWGPYGKGHRIISKPKVADITAEEAYGVVKEKVLELCRRT